MQHPSINTIQPLKSLYNKFDEISSAEKYRILQSYRTRPILSHKILLEYHEILLFIAAYPDNYAIKLLVNKELKRLASSLKKQNDYDKQALENNGLPFVRTIMRFSPDFLKWLMDQKQLQVTFDSFYMPTLDLNEVFKCTLPSLLVSETTAGLNNEDLLETLGVQKGHYLSFILSQFQQLEDKPFIKDLLTEKLDIYINLCPKNINFSRAFNHLYKDVIYYHQDLLKRFDHIALFNKLLPKSRALPTEVKFEAITVSKNAMALNGRETDPTTYMDEESFRLYNLERGIDIAIYGMTINRQLPLESYIGFTLFKNGYPASYGGVWVFGQRAKFGMNIFDTFRGGESGYIMCQLLRLFRQVLKISFFEVEAYQFGLDNHDGIESGAFWFYHRFGFRPMNKELFLLSEKEHEKIIFRKNYRSSTKTLLRLTGSNMSLNLGGVSPITLDEISEKLKKWVKVKHKNNYVEAEKAALDKFCKQTKLNFSSLSTPEQTVSKEISLWAMAMKINDSQRLKLMRSMIFAKTKDVYTYQKLLIEFFKIKD